MKVPYNTWIGKYSRPVVNVKAVRTDDHLYGELKRLKKEVAQLTEERNLLLRALGLKKAAAYLCPVGTLPRDNCEVRVDKATKRRIFNPFDVPFYECFPECPLWLAPAQTDSPRPGR